MIILDVIIIILQLINLYLLYESYKLLNSRDEFINFVKDKIWSITIEVGMIKNKIKEFENESSI